jgi:pimeloyl-ACP methyl ester carboxylesterase
MAVRNWFLIATLVTVISTSAFADEGPALPAGWTDGYVIANGIRIHYWRSSKSGDKPALVMAHGSSDDGRCWTNLAKELQGDFDIILPDARGHGLSDPPAASDSADVQAEDIAGLIKELKLTKPIVMGHSMGASAAAWFAAKHPDVPRAVVLEDPGLIPRSGAPARAAGPPMEERRAQILARNNMAFDEIVALCMKNSPRWGLSECRYWAPSKRLHHPNNVLRRLGDRPPMSELFTKITVPTLILKAGAEPAVRKQNEEIASKLKKGKIVHIDGAGHNVRREEKQRLLDALRPFLASL